MNKPTLNATDLILIGVISILSGVVYQKVVAPMLAPKK